MAARTYGSLPISCVTPAQLNALATKGISAQDIRDEGCNSALLNTCERDAHDLLNQYGLYNPDKGTYTTWGEFPIHWGDIEEEWKSATFTDQYGYRVGESVIIINDDGLLLTLYTATSNTPSPPGPFDPSLWSEVCHVRTSEPVGLPDLSTLLKSYPYYNPREYLTRWGEFESEWDQDLSTLTDSDTWKDARISKDFFYRQNDIVLYDSVCGDYTCVFIASQDMPADTSLVDLGPPPPSYFSRLYCIRNGKPNTCSNMVSCGPGREVVSLSKPPSDYICVPVESNAGVGPKT